MGYQSASGCCQGNIDALCVHTQDLTRDSADPIGNKQNIVREQLLPVPPRPPPPPLTYPRG